METGLIVDGASGAIEDGEITGKVQGMLASLADHMGLWSMGALALERQATAREAL